MTTYAFALDYVAENNLNSQATEWAIQNIEGFYNYRTIGDCFKLMTSVLSNQSELRELGKSIKHEEKIEKKRKKLRKDYQVSNEANSNAGESMESSITYLKQKHTKIKTILNGIKQEIEAKNEMEYVDKTVCDNLSTLTNKPEEVPVRKSCVDSSVDDKSGKLAKYCRYKRRETKDPCSNCNSLCSYTIPMLLERRNLYQEDIFKELKAHNHPTCRIIELENGGKRQRITAEAIEELIDHYVHSHHFVRPANFCF